MEHTCSTYCTLCSMWNTNKSGVECGGQKWHMVTCAAAYLRGPLTPSHFSNSVLSFARAQLRLQFSLLALPSLLHTFLLLLPAFTLAHFAFAPAFAVSVAHFDIILRILEPIKIRTFGQHQNSKFGLDPNQYFKDGTNAQILGNCKVLLKVFILNV